MLAALLATIALTACDPVYSIWYEVENRTQNDLYIIDKNWQDLDTHYNVISAGHVLILGVESEIGTLEFEFESFDGPQPFIEHLIIQNHLGDTTTVDVFSKEPWIWEPFEAGDTEGKTTLIIEDADF